MEEKTLLQVRVNRKTGLYIVEARREFRSHMDLQETLNFITSILVNNPFATVSVKDRRGGTEIELPELKIELPSRG